MTTETPSKLPSQHMLTSQAARDLTDQIRTGLEGVYQWIKAAYRGRAWIALGYGSWDEYVTREFGNLSLRPPREDQPQIIASMRDAGMSVRAISSATQLSVGTVHAELPSTVQNRTVDSGNPSKVTGVNGKSYAAKQPRKEQSTACGENNDVERVDDAPPVEISGQSSIEDELDRPATEFGITPLDLDDRAGQDRDRVARLLREFDGSGSAALPMTIKLASQVSGLVSPLDGASSIPDERLHDVAYTASRAVRTLTNVMVRLAGRFQGLNGTELRSNVRDTVEELDRLLVQMDGAA